MGKMMTLEAKKMGFYVAAIDPSPDCPSHSISDEHIISGFGDASAIRKLAEMTDVLTYESEHINARALLELEREGFVIYPSPESLINIQDKFVQKSILRDNGIVVGDFMALPDCGALSAAAEAYGYPFYIKTKRDGYDGKGNALITGAAAAQKAWEEFSGKEIYAEKLVPFIKEVSVLAARGISGEVAVYPVAENLHKRSILFETSVPAVVSDETAARAMETAAEVMRVFKGVGMFCVEMFVLEGGGVSVNEIAPRPHNSGHYTIEACVTSQFEQHIRAITGLPLGSTALLSPAVMRNLIGPEDWGSPSEYVYDGVGEALRLEGLSFHNYAKGRVSKARKMGHFTVLGKSVEEARKKACAASDLIKIVPA